EAVEHLGQFSVGRTASTGSVFGQRQQALRDMAGFRVVLFVVDNQEGVPMAVAATRSDVRGRDYVRTGFSHHLLLMPQGRWEVLLQSLSIEPYAIVQASGQVHPTMPESLLPNPVVSTVKR
ncbi:hypothetical protein, partial [Pseudomonas aeruginosa]|uniref:hypothetical protein n=1 Tax=Pseudomonas aeruginosa TaxID=287 RepID=UPI003982918D